MQWSEKPKNMALSDFYSRHRKVLDDFRFSNLATKAEKETVSEEREKRDNRALFPSSLNHNFFH